LRNITAMSKGSLFLTMLALAGAASAQPSPSGADVANLAEDVRGLTQRVNDLTLRVEQLEHQNEDLQRQAGGADRGYATLVQLNEAIAAVNQTIASATAASRSDTLAQVDVDLQKLARQVNAALAARGHAAAPAPDAAPAGDYPKTGESYTVVSGDTLAVIAKKTGARIRDILAANKDITDPSRIQVGQTLFIPGGK
jgi:nucleoid-associated protein YgaU